MFLLRIIFLPFIIIPIIGTALIEFMSINSDWDHWKRYNKYFIELLPWSKYKK